MTSDPSNTPGLNDASKAPSTGGGLGEAAIDLNCDMGEGMANDELIMPFISSVSIACGYHAGDEKTIWQTMVLAVKHKIAAGAHVSFFDKENFGRSEINLAPAEIYELVAQQLIVCKEIADSFDIKMNHVKPHGALYNMSAKDTSVAQAIAGAIKDFDKSLIVFGLGGSHSIHQAKSLGLRTANEVFADRTYQDDGSLTPRSQSNALIEDAGKAVHQVLQIVQRGIAITVSGKEIQMAAETICIHSDGRHAVEFAKRISEALKKEGIRITAPA